MKLNLDHKLLNYNGNPIIRKFETRKDKDGKPIINRDSEGKPIRDENGSITHEAEPVGWTLRMLLLSILDSQHDAKEIDVEERLKRARLQRAIYASDGEIDLELQTVAYLQRLADDIITSPSMLLAIHEALEG